MLTNRQLFINHLAQTSPAPLSLEIVKAEGTSMFDANGKEYTDLISGISVCNLGHRHPAVIEAIKKQLDLYMHLMVYGEYIQSPQVKLAVAITALLPSTLNSVYFVNSGSEAVEGALKLAKRYTGRTEIIAFKNAYHGSTNGALSLMSEEYFKNAFRPLLPDIKFLDFNDLEGIDEISEKTAGVFVEIIQGEAGAIPANPEFLTKLRKKCDETGAMFIADEIQSGFGRTGTFFAFEKYKVVPDMLLLAKGMGGGMPIGAFIASKQIMDSFTENPVLGHITTFGGHPVCCAASLATITEILKLNLKFISEMVENLVKQSLNRKEVLNISGTGLLLGIEFKSAAFNQNVIRRCIDKGVVTDWFLFAPHKMRIAPPLVISKECLTNALRIINEAISETAGELGVN